MSDRRRSRVLATIATGAVATAVWWAGAVVSEGPAPLEVDVRPWRGPPPPTRREDVVEVIHGQRVHDPYRWLEDGRDPAVTAWSDAQDAHARATLERMPAVAPIREALRAELDRAGIVLPVERRGDRYFYGKRVRGRDRTLWFVREGDGRERVLLDPDRIDPAGTSAIQAVFPSPDGRRIAYRIAPGNGDAASLRVRDVDTDREHPGDTIEGARWAWPQWTPEGDAFFYAGVPDDPSIPPEELAGHASVRRHVLGTSEADDRIEMAPLHDPRRILLPSLSDDGRWLIVHATHGSSGPVDIFVRDLVADTPFVPLVVGSPARTHAIGYEGALYLHTTDGAPRFRVVRVDPRRPGRADWQEIVPERADTLDRVGIIDGHLVLVYLHEVDARVQLYALDDDSMWEVALPEHGAVTNLFDNPDNRELLLVHSSLAERPRILRVPIPAREAAIASAEVWWAPADDGEPELVMERRVVTSADGTRVPVSLVHRADVPLDGDRPTVLYGYGGFGISVVPAYSWLAQQWADAGGVWAVAHLRGGGEFGEAWHRAGTGAAKPRVFEDFVAAAEDLVASGYTRPARLGILGGSNGGLLVGAAVTARPDLFGAVVCRVPLLDMVRYHRFGPAPFWIDEYGVATNADDFATLYAYSPYHRVREGVAYPPLLMMTGDHDDRVDPLHARKFTAALQAAQHDPSRVLLRVEKDAGHGGPASPAQSVDGTAHMLGFLLDTLAADRGAG